MPIINTTIPNLIGGISQQPDKLKFEGQCNDSLNCYATVKDGLSKRPYSEFISNLGVTSYSDHSFVTFINRSLLERYVCLYNNSAGLRIWNTITGEEATVTGDQSYLNTGSLDEDTTLKALTISDYTFICNKAKTVNLGSTTSSPLSNMGIVFVKQGDYSKNYTITLDYLDFTYTTGDNTNPAHASTEGIASNLRALIQSNSSFSATSEGNIVKFWRVNGNDFSLSVSDGIGGKGLQAAYKKVDDITDLPKACYQGFTIAVSGSDESDYDDYWVEFETANGDSFGDGSWVEVVAPETIVDLNASTMPITLVNTQANEFELREFDWDNKLAGDNNTNPSPSFVGRPISDLFFFKNRLGFISNENIIFSESGNYSNFWRTTVTGLLDSAPIDVSVSHTKVAILRHAVTTSSRLILFSDRTQFALKGDELLTNQTVSITPVTNFENDINLTPSTIGRFTYFGFQRGRFTGIREYYLDNIVNDFDQNEITAHVPELLKQDLKTITGTTSEDHIACMSRGSNEFQLYSYHWNGREKVMGSWSRHKLPCDTIIGFEFEDSDLVLITKTGEYCHLIKIPFEKGLSDGESFEESVVDGDTSISIGGLSNTNYNGVYNLSVTQYNGASQYEQFSGDGVIRRSDLSNEKWQIVNPKIGDKVIASSLTEGENPWDVPNWVEINTEQ